MTLTEEQKAQFAKFIKAKDWENVHGYYDDLSHARLKELDAEFIADLEKAAQDATFWYA